MPIWEPVPHEEAAKQLRDKPAVTKKIFEELLPELKARAFVISGVDAADALQAARDAIAEIPRGADWDATKAALTAALDPWLGEGAERRVELLLRWHAYQAYAVANVRNLDANKDIFPFRQYQTAQDERVRDTHAALNGIVLPADSPFWDRHTPPWEYGCRCDVRGVTETEAGKIRKEDEARAPEKKKLLEGADLERLEKEGRLIRGENQVVDVRSGYEKGKGGPDWSVKDLRIPATALRERYDAEVWEQFMQWADERYVDGLGLTVGDWMRGDRFWNTRPPVGRQVRIGQSAAAAPIQRALLAINRVHGDGTLPALEVTDQEIAGYAGYYHSLLMELHVKVRGSRPELTAVHELGHYLDHAGLGYGAGYGSEASSVFDGWRDAVKASQAHADLVAGGEDPSYWLSGRELWARSYAQWIATRSGDPVLLEQLQQRRETHSVAGSQWIDEDFVPIAEAIDELMRIKQWTRNS